MRLNVVRNVRVGLFALAALVVVLTTSQVRANVPPFVININQGFNALPIPMPEFDVVLTEDSSKPQNDSSNWSDLIRFGAAGEPPAGFAFMISDTSGLGLPGVTTLPAVVFIPESHDPLDVDPVLGQFTRFSPVPGLEFHFFSPSDVPEPATALVLLPVAAAGLALRRRRHAQA